MNRRSFYDIFCNLLRMNTHHGEYYNRFFAIDRDWTVKWYPQRNTPQSSVSFSKFIKNLITGEKVDGSASMLKIPKEKDLSKYLIEDVQKVDFPPFNPFSDYALSQKALQDELKLNSKPEAAFEK